MPPVFPAVGYVVDPPLEEVSDHTVVDIAQEEPSEEITPVPDVLEGEDAVKVIIRVRPPLERELKGFRPYAPATAIDPSGRAITLSENLRAAANNGVENGVIYATYRFAFDRVYGPDTPQEAVYEESARAAVTNVLQGYNASIIAFGQTGAGKTHTMTGAKTGDARGIIPRAVDDVFAHIQRDTGERCKFLVRASYLQIYNEVISDLLKPESTNLAIREDKRRGVHVDGLSEWVVRTPADVYALMERGAEARATGATKLNELSSRSHAIFMIIVEKSSIESDHHITATAAAQLGGTTSDHVRQTIRVGKLNLVDLAGSERVHLTGATGKRLEESKKINQSLSALGNVIAALTPKDQRGRGARPHVPYRDSKLTRILEDSLGGNCKTMFMAMISPAVEAFAESLSTLKFAHRAKCVRNAPRVNEDLDHATLLRRYEKELKKLRAELQQRSKDLVDRRFVLQLDEARRREQADKIAAITALERQSAEIARQKAAMAALQSRIASMQSQLLIGGQNVEDTPAFRTLLAAEQARIREEYEAKVAELEGERRSVAQDRATVERLTGLLLKQRDVMLALTDRLGERDKEILSLQTQLESAETRAKEAEDRLDRKMAELIAVRKSVVVHDVALSSQLDEETMAVVEEKEDEEEGDERGYSKFSAETLKEENWKIGSSPGRGSGRRVQPLPLVQKGSDRLGDTKNKTEPTCEIINIDNHHNTRRNEEKGPVEVRPVLLTGSGTASGSDDGNTSSRSTTPRPAPNDLTLEKDALKFILEKKILKLVSDMEHSMTQENELDDQVSVVHSQPHDNNDPAEKKSSVSHASRQVSQTSVVSRQLNLLKKIVSQTVEALH